MTTAILTARLPYLNMVVRAHHTHVITQCRRKDESRRSFDKLIEV